ncbi:fibronectin type III domain-containing protein, partial [Bacillus cereus group sp. TH43LC]
MKIKKCGVFIAFLLVFCFSFSVSAEAETDVLLGKKPYLDFEFSRVPNEPSSMNITDADKMSDYDLRSDTFYYDLGRNYSISKVLLEARTSTGNPNALVLNLYDANKNRIYSSGQKEFIFPYNGYNNAPFLPMEKKYDYNNVRYVTVGGSVRVRYVKLFGESYIPSVSGIKGVSDINDISFSWSNPSDDSYRGVKIFKDNSLIVTLGSSDSSYKVQELEADKSYKFRFISLYEENGQIKESKAIEKEEKTLVDPKKIPPSSVTDLKANSTDKSVKLTWKNPKDKVLKGVTLFQDNKKIAETDVKEVFEVDNLKPKTEYGFGVV